MNAFKKKILLAGMVAVFAFIITIGSTYAWFTIGQTSLIGEINMTVQTSTSLMIVMDDVSGGGYDYDDPTDKAFLDNPGNYVTMLSNDTIKTEYLFDSIVFQPITTEDGIDWIKQDLISAASSDPAVPGQFMEFGVWILSQDKDVTVSLMNLQVIADNVNIYQNIVVDAIRLAITPASGTTKIYGQDKDYDYVFPSLVTIDSGVESTLTALHAIYYESTSPVAGESTDTLGDTTSILSLVSNVPQKVTIRVWLEGWDADCNNNAVEADFTISFGFIVKEVL